MSSKVFKLQTSSPHVGLVYRQSTKAAMKATEEFAKFLKQKGAKVFSISDQKPVTGTSKASQKNLDLVCVFGGDGTYLRALRWMGDLSVPILGFNMGQLGFLTSFSAENSEAIFERLLQKKLNVQNRATLKATLHRSGKQVQCFRALNDVVVERGSLSHLISASLSLENSWITDMKADGFIFSSPSGSSAYNLAAGGPLLDPEANVINFTPIAAHSLTARPFVFPDHRSLTLKIHDRTTKAHLVIDGHKVDSLRSGDQIMITRSKVDHCMIVEKDYDYFHLLREKLNFGER